MPCSSGFAPWIEELVAQGITGGCGGGNYCPRSPCLRQQMAVFLLRTEVRPGLCAASLHGDFLDVPCSSTLRPLDRAARRQHITGGCGGGNYCPLTSANRGQMATFLVKTFGLQ